MAVVETEEHAREEANTGTKAVADSHKFDEAALERWLEPERGHTLEDHLYIVDPLGNWMMRAPADPDPVRLKKDLDKLLRASAWWNRPKGSAP